MHVMRIQSLALLIVWLAVITTPTRAQQKSEQIYAVGNGIRPPKLTNKCEPDFTALRALDPPPAIKGQVVLRLVVEPDGSVSHIKVVKGLGREVNEAVVNGIGKCQFDPAIREKDKQPVAVSISFQVNLKMH